MLAIARAGQALHTKKKILESEFNLRYNNYIKKRCDFLEKLKLNKNMGKVVKAHGYSLSAEKEYVINLKEEFSEQTGILQTVQTMGLEAMQDWWKWLEANGFNTDMPNPTNKHVAPFYGKKPLWETNLSKGIVVKDENDDDDYYVVMECSRENEGFKYTQIILTLGGCM